jgi:Co/Zn/Cd efflux system component
MAVHMINKVLSERYSINHATIQVEPEHEKYFKRAN